MTPAPPRPDGVAPDRDLVHVVCVVFNPGDELRDFADSLRDATRRPVELTLVDNGGPSAVVEELVAAGRAVVVRHPEGNVGYGRAANLGATRTPAAWLVVANPDLRWAPGALDVLLDAAAIEPRAGSVGPRVLNADGTVYPSARAVPSLKVGAGHALFSRVWPGNPWTARYREGDASLHGERRPVGWLSGACLLLRPEAFAQVGGFDERYFMFFEDVDLGERLGGHGWLNLYVPEAEVTHLQGTSWKHSPAPMIRAHHASARRYLFARYDRWYQAPLRLAIAGALYVRQQAEVAASTKERRQTA
jgi:N-acetylglucosaminyl-diphospho-decaprenol L-rhamnosyltransferase